MVIRAFQAENAIIKLPILNFGIDKSFPLQNKRSMLKFKIERRIMQNTLPNWIRSHGVRTIRPQADMAISLSLKGTFSHVTFVCPYILSSLCGSHLKSVLVKSQPLDSHILILHEFDIMNDDIRNSIASCYKQYRPLMVVGLSMLINYMYIVCVCEYIYIYVYYMS